MFALTVSDLRDLREKSRENDLQQTRKTKSESSNAMKTSLPAPLLPRLACSRGAAGDRLRRPDRETCALPRHNNDSRTNQPTPTSTSNNINNHENATKATDILNATA